MKSTKLVSIILAAALMTSALCACSSNKGNNGGKNTPATNAAAGNQNNAKSASNSVSYSSEGGKTIFTVDPSFSLHPNSWMGIVPAGKAYKTEGEADEVDLLWVNPYEFEEISSSPAKFVFDSADFAGVGEGNYIMVLCENDDDESSKVFFYFPITIKDGTITADLSKLVVN